MLSPHVASFDQSRYQSSVGPAHEAYSVHFAPEVDSTMNLNRWFATRGVAVEPGLCLIAGRQTHGVGQHGSWVSNDQDVKLSLVLPEVESSRDLALLNCIAALAVQRTLTELADQYAISLDTPPPFQVKLVNDVLVPWQGAFRKISGSLAVSRHDLPMRSLLETRDGFSFPEDLIILGIGINLQTLERPVTDPRFAPVALEDLIGDLVSREIAVGSLLRHFHGLRTVLRGRPEMLLHALSSELATQDGEVLAVSKGGAEVMGYVRELGLDGVRIAAGASTVTIPLEDIQRVIPAPKLN